MNENIFRILAALVLFMGVGISSYFRRKADRDTGEKISRSVDGSVMMTLITSGPYRFVRHPIYTAFVLILGSTFLISANWFIGFAWLGMTVLEVASRIGFEESLMLEYFGDQYREYMKKTGRLLPRLIQ